MEPNNLKDAPAGEEVEKVEVASEVEAEAAASSAENDSAEASYPEGEHADQEGDGVERDGEVVEEVTKEFYDKDEEIITKNFVEKGIDRVSSKELIDAGIDSDRIRPHSFRIGIYSISRVVLISKYTIEKIVK